jgi:hypothetical protein
LLFDSHAFVVRFFDFIFTEFLLLKQTYFDRVPDDMKELLDLADFKRSFNFLLLLLDFFCWLLFFVFLMLIRSCYVPPPQHASTQAVQAVSGAPFAARNVGLCCQVSSSLLNESFEFNQSQRNIESTHAHTPNDDVVMGSSLNTVDAF